MFVQVVCAVMVATVVAHSHPHDHAHEHTHDTHNRATVKLEGDGIHGNITFTQEEGKVHVQGVITGLPEGHYALTIYEKGDIINGCEHNGGHFNPENKDHGHRDDENRHAGDLGNAIFDKNKVSKVDFYDRLISLKENNFNIVGRALMLHENPDDFGKTEHPDSKITGNSGKRIACGVIGRA